ncbi:uncharacterized protein DAT39_023238, partial [Clarias magur]
REKFSIPVSKITVEDDSGTEVDNEVFADLSTMEGICFVIDDSHDDKGLGPSQSSPSTPQSSSTPSGSFLSVSLSSSDSDTSRQPKRIRCDEVLSSSAGD